MAEDLLPQRQRHLAVAAGVPAAARAAEPNLGQRAGVRDGKAAQPQRVQQPEYRAARAHPERQRDDRGCGERSMPPQQTQAEPDVLPQRLETRAAATSPYLCLDRVDLPELQRRRAPRLGRRRTRRRCSSTSSSNAARTSWSRSRSTRSRCATLRHRLRSRDRNDMKPPIVTLRALSRSPARSCSCAVSSPSCFRPVLVRR